MENFDLVSSLQALPETDPIEIDGVQFGGGTCGCAFLSLVVTVCVVGTVC